MRRVQRAQIDRREPRLPVVRVHDAEGAAAAASAHSSAARTSTREAAWRCPDNRRRRPRKRLAIEQLGSVDEHRARAVAERRLEERRSSPCSRRRSTGKRSTSVPASTPRYRGMSERHVPPKPRKRRRQRAEHVRQPAGLRERQRLGADDQDGPRGAAERSTVGSMRSARHCINRRTEPRPRHGYNRRRVRPPASPAARRSRAKSSSSDS